MKFERLFGCAFCLVLQFSLPLACSAASGPISAPQEAPHHSLFLAEEPIIKVLPDGKAEVHCQTTEACWGGEVFLGIFPEAAPLSYPVYRVTGEIVRQDSLHLLARCDLKELETPRDDINDLKGQGGGQVAIRLQLWGQRLHIIDRIFAYGRSDDGRYRRTPALIEGPLVDGVTDSSAIISFEFDLPVAGCLNIMPSDGTFYFTADQSRHGIRVGQLAPDQMYRYVIHFQDQDNHFSTADIPFHTAPTPKANRAIRFAVLCDSRGALGGAETYLEGVNGSCLRSLLNVAYAQKAEFILFPGDLISGSSSSVAEIEAQFRSWKRVAAPVGGSIPIYEGMGNHDQSALWIEGGSERDFIARSGPEAGEVIFAQHFVNPTNGPAPTRPDYPPYLETVYSFDWGKAHFAMLNSNYFQKGSGEKVADRAGQLQGHLRPEQLVWLEDDLRQARDRDQEPLFVLAHEPAFPNGGHVQDGMWWNGKRPEIIAIRDQFWTILCRNRVTAAFFGDEHNYSRTLIDDRINPAFDHPIWQIVTGGAGAPFYHRDAAVPWANAVKAFFPLTHLCLLEIDGSNVWLTVLSAEGLIIERVNLSE